MEPLPRDSLAFQAALQDADHHVDESNLALWDEDPPYAISPSADTPQELEYTDWLVEVMHGRWLRQENERNRERAMQLACHSAKEQKKILKREKALAMGEWEALASFLKGYRGGSREVKMAKHLLQWRARTVFDLFLLIERLE
jgi:hypothetical protein